MNCSLSSTRRWPASALVPLKISDILDAETNERAIQVQLAASGKAVWIPRKVNPEFFPGLVYIPAWLYQQIKPYN